MIEKKLNLHFRRFEFKYILEKDVADRIIPDLMNYMEWDPYVGENDYYECHSLYMDNRNLKAYHEKIDGILNRKKVRIRSYTRDYKPGDPLFFELKRKSGEIILKDRVVIPGKHLPEFIEDPFSLLKYDEFDKDFLNEFIFEYTNYRMDPKILVSYKRKPFFSKINPNFRVTFDYDMEFAPADRADYDLEYTKMNEDFVVMEVKFNGSVPKWFHNILNMYKLDRKDSCKYCFGIDTLYGEPSFA